jgi:hypothetical protein
MKSKWNIFLPVLLISFSSAVSYAETNPCQSDVEKYCSDASSKDPREIGKCLESHASDLTAECSSFHEKMKARHEAFHQQIKKLEESCKNDSSQYCPDLRGPQQMGCLVQNTANLSDSCKTQVEQMKTAHQRVKPSSSSQ